MLAVGSLSLTLLMLAACSPLCADQELFRAAAENNVNQRYTIESVSVAGVRFDQAKIPAHLRNRIFSMVGERCDVAALEQLGEDLRKELHLRAVTQRLSKGTQPDRVHVDFEVVRKTIDISVPKFLFHSRQGLTGEVDASARASQNNTFTLGVVSNGDDLVEHFTGIAARYDNLKIGSDRIRFGILFEDYHEVWNQKTLDGIGPGSGDLPNSSLLLIARGGTWRPNSPSRWRDPSPFHWA